MEKIGEETRTVLYIVGVVVRLLPFVGPLFHLGIIVWGELVMGDVRTIVAKASF